MNIFERRVRQELAKKHVSIIELVNCIIGRGFELRASDIHIDPTGHNITVKFRIDGIIAFGYSISRLHYQAIISRIKVLSNLRTDEHQSPKDARFKISINTIQDIDIRVSLIPTYYGENVVLRLPSKSVVDFSLETLGFQSHDCVLIRKAIEIPNGMILVTGPTGSGKTTTLYTLMKLLNTGNKIIITLEDPIEHALEGIRQIQVSTAHNLTFSNGLRSILRQDPDIIMVGEIRDSETASLAINTALTGHLVLTTLHANSASSTHSRLFDLKIQPYLIASTVNLIISQRLIRRICQSCSYKKAISPEQYHNLLTIFDKQMLDSQSFFEGKGCDACDHTGFHGRIALYELILVNDEIRDLLAAHFPAQKIIDIAKAHNMTSMAVDGIKKAQSGLTTLGEVIRVISI